MRVGWPLPHDNNGPKSRSLALPTPAREHRFKRASDDNTDPHATTACGAPAQPMPAGSRRYEKGKAGPSRWGTRDENRGKIPSLCTFFLARKLGLRWGAKAGLQVAARRSLRNDNSQAKADRVRFPPQHANIVSIARAPSRWGAKAELQVTARQRAREVASRNSSRVPCLWPYRPRRLWGR